MKTIIYRSFSIMAIFVVLASVVYVKANPHDYKECLQQARIAAANDITFNSKLDPDYKITESNTNQIEIYNNIVVTTKGIKESNNILGVKKSFILLRRIFVSFKLIPFIFYQILFYIHIFDKALLQLFLL